MDNKKEKALVLGATANITFAVANVLLGIKKHSPDLQADFYIFHKDITEADQQLLNSIIPVNFIEYQFPSNNTDDLEKFAFKRYSQLAFSRYECFNMLDKYKKVLWLDVDTLIQKDISGLFDLCDNGIGLYQEASSLQECFAEPVAGYNMDAAHYNSGVIV
ncbi:MAG: glycosyltransferase, partial [Candidatus Gastranaerophilaceae bacterium]